MPTPPEAVLAASNFTNAKTLLTYGQLYTMCHQLQQPPPPSPQQFVALGLADLLKSKPLSISLARKLIMTLLNQCLPIPDIVLLLTKAALSHIWLTNHTTRLLALWQLAEASTLAERNLRLGNQPIYHLEFLVLSIMQITTQPTG
jgi:hypothetical protein